MSFPAYFSQIPRLTLHDPLAEFLGAAAGGCIDYGYEDAVRLAGHSCPTVAGAYLMTWHALRNLYGDAVPERGAIEVQLREPFDGGTAGVVANVVGLLTGAAGAAGFKGLGGRFARCGLMRERAPIAAPLRFRRRDSGAACSTDYHPQRVPADPAMPQVMAAALAGDGDAAARFAALWQDRVARILTTHFHDAALVVVRTERG